MCKQLGFVAMPVWLNKKMCVVLRSCYKVKMTVTFKLKMSLNFHVMPSMCYKHCSAVVHPRHEQSILWMCCDIGSLYFEVHNRPDRPRLGPHLASNSRQSLALTISNFPPIIPKQKLTSDTENCLLCYLNAHYM